MHLENYVEDLEQFVKERLTYFVSEYVEDIHRSDKNRDDKVSHQHNLKDFIDRELQKVTIEADSAYITEDPITGGMIFKVNLRMGDKFYSTNLTLNPSVFR